MHEDADEAALEEARAKSGKPEDTDRDAEFSYEDFDPEDPSFFDDDDSEEEPKPSRRRLRRWIVLLLVLGLLANIVAFSRRCSACRR